jgi:hypothetical protein
MEGAVGKVTLPGIQCWPYGHGTRGGDCDEEIPDSNFETMRRFGWGFVFARDDGSPTGEGPFLACPEHRDDCDAEGRQRARQANHSAKSEAGRAQEGEQP